MNLYGSDLFGFPREWLSEERDDTDVFAPPRFWIVAPRLFLLPDDEDEDDDDDPFNREQHREGEEKEATKTLILFSLTHTHTHTLFPSENSLPRVSDSAYAPCLRVCALKTLISCDDTKEKIFSLEKERKHHGKLGLKTLNTKTPKNLFGRKSSTQHEETD